MKKIFFLVASIFTFWGCDSLQKDISPMGNLPSDLPEFFVEPNQVFLLDNAYFMDDSTDRDISAKSKGNPKGLASRGILGGADSYHIFTFEEDFTGKIDIKMKINRRWGYDKITVNVLPAEKFPCDGGPVDDFVLTEVDESVLVDVLANDKFCNMRVNRVEILSGNSKILKVEGNKIRYTPEKGFEGSRILIYRISASKSNETYFYTSRLELKSVRQKSSCQTTGYDDFIYQLVQPNGGTMNGTYNSSVLDNDIYCKSMNTKDLKIIEKPKFSTATKGIGYMPYDPPTIKIFPINSTIDFVDNMKYEICSNGNCSQSNVRIKMKRVGTSCIDITNDDEFEFDKSKGGTLKIFPIANDEICSMARNFKVQNISNQSVGVDYSINSGEVSLKFPDGIKDEVKFEYSYTLDTAGGEKVVKSIVKIKIK